MRWATAIQIKVQMTGGGTVGNNGYGFVGGMRGIVFNLNIQHGSQPAKTLCTYAQGVDLVEQFKTQLFVAIAGTSSLKLGDIDMLKQRFFGHQHGFFSSAANTYAEHARWTPASTHSGNHFQYPVDH